MKRENKRKLKKVIKALKKASDADIERFFALLCSRGR